VHPEVEPASAQRVCVAGLSGPATARAVESADMGTSYSAARAGARGPRRGAIVWATRARLCCGAWV